MTVAGHIATSYLLAESSILLGYPLNNREISIVIFAGSAVDLDYLYGWLTNKKGEIHHNFITHTPAAALLFGLVLTLALNNYLSEVSSILVVTVLLLHLVLDNLSYWFYKIGLQNNSPYPQINWGYPFTKFSCKLPQPGNNKQVILQYISKSKSLLILEGVIILAATLVLITRPH